MRGTNFDILEKIRQMYAEGTNLTDYLNTINKSDSNTEEAILISYEFQAGSYTKAYYENSKIRDEYAAHLAKEIRQFHPFYMCEDGKLSSSRASLLEVGVGEATTLLGVIKNLNAAASECFGFDLSWSRIHAAKHFLAQNGLAGVNLNTGNLFQTPYSDNSFDVVYTAHSLEPNGGREEEGLRELYRITSKYLFLFEPGYELAGAEAKARMEKHGYVKNLYSTAKGLGYQVVEHKLLDFSLNPLNPTSVLVIEKNSKEQNAQPLVCPLTRKTLSKHENVMFADESYLMYPVIGDIPCLLPENAIIGVNFDK